jgi:hypothetical protein
MEGLGLRLEALLAIPLCSVLGLLTSLSVDGVPFGPYFVRASVAARGSGGGGLGAQYGARSYC